ncbi:AMP-binding protein [Serratia marcescens]
MQDAGHSLSYRDMQRQAALLAERLTAAGIQPGDIVAVALPRSVRLSLALTAIVQTARLAAAGYRLSGRAAGLHGGGRQTTADYHRERVGCPLRRAGADATLRCAG